MPITHSRIAVHIESAFRQAAGGLTGKEFTIAAIEKPDDAPSLTEPIIWQQSFSAAENPALWMCVGKDLWESLARMTLEAAGIEPITDEDSRSTWQEIIGQTIGGIASGLTSDLLHEITSTEGVEIAEEPLNLAWTWFSVAVAADGTQPGPWLFRAAWSNELAAAYDPKPAQPEKHAGPEAVSKTFDLLLDVALPVSVSFGKTSLQIREVLKLNTGSIIELNRFVTDPVEVIVNDCVIARGEVVVVDGNYGVRINQLATREDRLRTGMGEHHRIGIKP
jgi:flagellar motor switch protein FliN/FliY